MPGRSLSWLDVLKQDFLNGKDQSYICDSKHQFLPEAEVRQKLNRDFERYINGLSNMELLELIEQKFVEHTHD